MIFRVLIFFLKGFGFSYMLTGSQASKALQFLTIDYLTFNNIYKEELFPEISVFGSQQLVVK